MGPDPVGRDRVISVFRIVPEALEDIRSTARDLASVSEEFGRTRSDLGLSEFHVWLLRNAQGTFMVVELTGDVETYFHGMRTDGGVDGWLRDKLAQWAGFEGLFDELCRFPEREDLFSWRQATS